MDKGAWWATIHGVARIVHDLATKSPTLMSLNKILTTVS